MHWNHNIAVWLNVAVDLVLFNDLAIALLTLIAKKSDKIGLFTKEVL
jgi:hypothetical protein